MHTIARSEGLMSVISYSYTAAYGAELARRFCLWLWVALVRWKPPKSSYSNTEGFFFQSPKEKWWFLRASFVEDAKMSLLLLLATYRRNIFYWHFMVYETVFTKKLIFLLSGSKNSIRCSVWFGLGWSWKMCVDVGVTSTSSTLNFPTAPHTVTSRTFDELESAKDGQRGKIIFPSSYTQGLPAAVMAWSLPRTGWWLQL